jgi:uncharacterized protein YceH (UPF0502 family)
MDQVPPSPSSAQPPRWRPIAARDRRVLGVLIEKAKTTPEAYPLSVNALRAGCNQKNNRFPLMEMELEDVEESLERLRAVGAVVEVQGGSRVSRFRHCGYEWLGVDKVELGVMAELLLRGAQTEGELRGRAARMDPIPDLTALRPILNSLAAKKLIVSLTPAGRGHVLTHALYEPRELEKLQREHAGGAVMQSHATREVDDEEASEPASTAPAAMHAPHTHAPQTHTQHAPLATALPMPTPAAHDGSSETIKQLQAEVEELREQLAQVRKDLDDLWANFR